MFIHIEEVPKHVGKKVNLRGWVYRHREGKDIVFLILRDVSGTIQCVAKEDIKGFSDAQKSSIEASVELSGVVHKDKRAPTGYEIEIKEIKLIGSSDNFPITEYQSTDHLLDVRHLWLRSRRLTNIFKIRSEVFGAIDSFFRSRDFFEIQSPSLTATTCEGAGTLFEVSYFGKKAYLTQSWQLYAEAVLPSLEKIYCIAPSFRAEKSRTRRHLAEYWHCEAEMAWVGNEENMKIQEELITHIVQTVLSKRKKELLELGRDLKKLEGIKPPFKRIKYEEALDALKKDGLKMKWGDDFGVKEEKQLTTHFNKPFFITNFPKETKAFYMKEDPKDNKTYLCSDLLAPEGYGEIIGASEREVDVNKLIERLKKQGEKISNYQWYLDIRKYGSIPHSGFGLGIERLVMWITGIDHIRDTTTFPRTMTRIYP
ncbi:MAG: asparagine--tRNA ligase [Nanoarchaeota archaeon]